MKYKVNIEELLSRIVEVEADNEEDAENKVRAMYNNEEIVLNADDLSSVELFVQEIEKAKENHVSFEEVIEWIHHVKLVNVIPVR